MTWALVLVTVLFGLALLGLLTDLGGRDLVRTRAVAEAALRRANEDP